MKEDKIVSLKFYRSLIDAKLDANILKQNDIECTVNTDTMVGVYPLFDDKEKGIEILVFSKDVERSKEILDNYHKNSDNS